MTTLYHNSAVKDILTTLRSTNGYYITNTARDLSQSDFKNRILLHTDLLAAPCRDRAGFFSLEITGGASIHVDMLRKQVNPFTKLKILRKKMPNTMFQTLCRGVNLFGYRPYPQNVIRFTVQSFAQYVDVWRTFDFLNHVPNMVAVLEEVAIAERLNEPCLCFSTGEEHSNSYYIRKAREIVAVTGEEIVLCIKNHGGLGSPARIGSLVDALKQALPEIPIHYHGHNTDSNDVGRIVEAVKNGAVIVDAADSAFTGFYGPPPVQSVIYALREWGHECPSINEEAIVETSDILRDERKYYAQFESQTKGFQPNVQTHKLPGGAMGSSLEQAVKGNFLEQMPDILNKELPRVQKELGNFWSVTPGSQILWTTAVSNVLGGERYGTPSGDLRNLLLGKYGPFPFYHPEEWIYQKVLGDDWQDILEKEGGIENIADMDLGQERFELAEKIGYEPTDEQLVLYLQHPNDAVEFFKFEEEYGKSYVLPPAILFRSGGFEIGEKLSFRDCEGKEHLIEIGPSPVNDTGETSVYLTVDHHPSVFTFTSVATSLQAAEEIVLSKEEILDLAKAGDLRAPFAGTVVEIAVTDGQEVMSGDRVAVLEAMKMQTPVLSETDGIVTAIYAKKGDKLQPGRKLLKIDTDQEMGK